MLSELHRGASLHIQVQADNKLKLKLNKSGKVVYPRGPNPIWSAEFCSLGNASGGKPPFPTCSISMFEYDLSYTVF